jgi:hypothetical protein
VSVHGESHVETSSLSIVVGGHLSAPSFGGIERSFQRAFDPNMPAQNSAFSRDSRLTMRLLVHVLARLAITATCTNSAAAPDLRAGPPEMFLLHHQSVGVSDVQFSIRDRGRQA